MVQILQSGMKLYILSVLIVVWKAIVTVETGRAGIKLMKAIELVG